MKKKIAKIFLAIIILSISLLPQPPRSQAAAPVLGRLIAGEAANELVEKMVSSYLMDQSYENRFDAEQKQKTLDGVNKRLADYEKFIQTPEGQAWKADVESRNMGKVPITRSEVVAEAIKNVQNPTSTSPGKVLVRGIGGLIFLDMVYDTYKAIEAAQGANKFFDTASSIPPEAGTRAMSIPGFTSGVFYYEADKKHRIEVRDEDNIVQAGSVYFGSGVTSYYFLIESIDVEEDLVAGGNYVSTVFRIFGLAGNGVNTNNGPFTTNKPIGNSTSIPGDEFDILTSGGAVPPIGPIQFPDGILPNREQNPEFPTPYKPASPASYPDKVVEIPLSPPGTVVENPTPIVRDPLPGSDPAPDAEPGTWPGTNPGTNPNPGTDPGPNYPEQTNPNGDPNAIPGTDPLAPPEPTPGTGDPAAPLPEGTGDPGGINWPKLKLIPAAFTTAFPFSLPFDISRALNASFGSVTDSKEKISFSYQIKSVDTEPWTVTIPAIVMNWVDYYHMFIVFAFDIGLIYAIYRLFGGAS